MASNVSSVCAWRRTLASIRIHARNRERPSRSPSQDGRHGCRRSPTTWRSSSIPPHCRYSGATGRRDGRLVAGWTPSHGHRLLGTSRSSRRPALPSTRPSRQTVGTWPGLSRPAACRAYDCAGLIRARLELVPAAVVGYWGIAFTPDGSRLLYATKSAQNPAGRLFAVSVQGGPSMPVSSMGSTAQSAFRATESEWRSIGPGSLSLAPLLWCRGCRRQQPSRDRDRQAAGIFRPCVLLRPLVVSG